MFIVGNYYLPFCSSAYSRKNFRMILVLNLKFKSGKDLTYPYHILICIQINDKHVHVGQMHACVLNTALAGGVSNLNPISSDLCNDLCT
jgi:hypothetical protein